MSYCISYIHIAHWTMKKNQVNWNQNKYFFLNKMLLKSSFAICKPLYSNINIFILCHHYDTWAPFDKWFNWNPAWISNHMPCKVCDEITYTFPNFVPKVWEWISNFIPHFNVITYPCYTNGYFPTFILILPPKYLSICINTLFDNMRTERSDNSLKCDKLKSSWLSRQNPRGGRTCQDFHKAIFSCDTALFDCQPSRQFSAIVVNSGIEGGRESGIGRLGVYLIEIG